MKYRICIIFFMIFVVCGAVHSNPEILVKFKTSNFENKDKLVYDLYLMGDKALPFLIRSLTDEDRQVRESAMYFLQNYYPDSRTLSVLTVVFLHDTDNWLRTRAARMMADIDPEYAKRLLAKHLKADAETQKIVIDVFLSLKDKRVVPLLVEMLEDPKSSPEKRRFAAYALADFKDKRATPVLLDLLKYPAIVKEHVLEEVLEKLARLDDERTMPILVSVFDSNSALRKKTSNSLFEKVINALSQSVPSSLQLLLEELKQVGSKDTRESILRVLREIRDPKLALICEKTYLETDDSALKSVLEQALINMGEEGFKSILSILQQKPTASVLGTLSTYNSTAAIETVASFALDKSSSLRYNAIGSLAEFGALWKAEVSKYIPQLLADSNPKVKFLILDLIRQMKITTAVPDLKRLTQDPDENVRNTAYLVLDLLLGKTQLKLEVETDQQRYDYGQPIEFTYHLKNVSNHPIKIIIAPNIRLVERLEIQQPDDTSARYKGLHADFFGPGPDDYKTLHPGDELTDTISISQLTHWLHQSGRYTINLHIIPWGSGTGYGFMAWPYWISSKVHVDIDPPTREEVDAILARIDAGDFGDAGKTYHQLCELNKSGLFPALKTRALIPLDKFRRYDPTSVAQWLGNKFIMLSKTELVPKCIEMIGEEGMIQVLTAIGDERAIEPMRLMAIRGSADAALALQQFGDDKAVKWCSELAQRKLRHWNKRVRIESAEMLRTLQQLSYVKQGQFRQWSWNHRSLASYEFYNKNESPALASNWAEIVEKSVTMEGLKALLEHPIPAVRLGAAYDLAYLGDKSGVHLIEQDLHANDVDTRMHARDILLKLRSE